MTGPSPVRQHVYNGPTTRGARWDSYRRRPGDIIISAPPKSGTTWTQAIVAMLIAGTAEIEFAPSRVSPWFDSNFEPLAQMLDRLDAQSQRRYLKTHTPLDGLPYFPDVEYMAVYRHPLDVFYSMASLRFSEAEGNVRARAALPPDIRGFILACIREPFVEGVGEQLSVASLARHFLGFWNWRGLANVHLLHYADMQRNLVAAVKAIAAALGIAADERMVKKIAEAAGFARMKARADQYVPESGAGWKRPSDFFRAGGGGQWQDLLTAQDIGEYHRAIAAAIPDAAALHWIENGSR